MLFRNKSLIRDFLEERINGYGSSFAMGNSRDLSKSRKKTI